jgi:hypothetical protein
MMGTSGRFRRRACNSLLRTSEEIGSWHIIHTMSADSIPRFKRALQARLFSLIQ